MPELILTREARQNLALLPSELREAVAETIGALALEPRTVGKPLVGRLRGSWSAAVGNYRVLYTIEESTASSRVIVRAIRHRAVAYRTRRT
ncbi:MAG: type II toxin-antitoxin system RelE family toxin [Gaiellaceae bacterium]